MNNNSKTQKMMYFAILLALTFLLYLTPLGFVQIGPLALTTQHIPVIVTSIVLGWRWGAGMGAVFGCLSLYRATTSPGPTSFMLSPFIPVPGSNHGDWHALLVSVGTRILVGITPALVIMLFKKNGLLKHTLGYAIAGLTGALTNTIFVLGFMGIFFSTYKNVTGFSSLLELIGATIMSNGIFEASLAMIVAAALANVFRSVDKKLNS
jgi:uncharacterized membrane protein